MYNKPIWKSKWEYLEVVILEHQQAQGLLEKYEFFLDNTVKGDYTFEWSSQDVVVQNPTSNNAFFDAPAVPYGEETYF